MIDEDRQTDRERPTDTMEQMQKPIEAKCLQTYTDHPLLAEIPKSTQSQLNTCRTHFCLVVCVPHKKIRRVPGRRVGFL